MTTPAIAVPATDAVEQTLDGERRAQRTLRCLHDRMALGPDELMWALADVIEMDGGSLPFTPRLRAFCRAVSKRLETTPRPKP